MLLTKISYKDETDPIEIERNLEKKLMEETVKIFIDMLTFNPKLLIDLKKYILRVIITKRNFTIIFYFRMN